MLQVEPIVALALLAGGTVAGFVNVVAAGGSLITMPLLIFMGIPATSANGTIRIAILVQGLTATFRYHRSGAIPWKAVARLVIPLWVGALAGAMVASQMADTDFKSMMGWISLVAGAIVIVDFKKIIASRQGEMTTTRTIIFLISMTGVGFYGGLAQAGVGYLFLASLVIGGGYTLLQANVMKAVLVTAFTPLAILVFGLNSKIHLGYAVILAVGHALGAYLGAGITLTKGVAVIRPVLAIVVVGAAVKLIFFS